MWILWRHDYSQKSPSACPVLVPLLLLSVTTPNPHATQVIRVAEALLVKHLTPLGAQFLPLDNKKFGMKAVFLRILSMGTTQARIMSPACVKTRFLGWDDHSTLWGGIISFLWRRRLWLRETFVLYLVSGRAGIWTSTGWIPVLVLSLLVPRKQVNREVQTLPALVSSHSRREDFEIYCHVPHMVV